MIINMTGGGSRIQVVDFTLTADQLVDTSGGIGNHTLEISNVFVPAGLVNGFTIMRNANIITDIDFVVSHFYSDYRSDGVTEGPLFAVYYRSNGFMTMHNTNSNAFYYRHNERKLNVATAMSNCFVKAGNYRLLIW